MGIDSKAKQTFLLLFSPKSPKLTILLYSNSNSSRKPKIHFWAELGLKNVFFLGRAGLKRKYIFQAGLGLNGNFFFGLDRASVKTFFSGSKVLDRA